MPEMLSIDDAALLQRALDLLSYQMGYLASCLVEKGHKDTLTEMIGSYDSVRYAIVERLGGKAT